ncbi:MAG TPA: fatty acid--CoA ligase family protein [Chthoniobacterales bacterium]|nr:fatty acid--CoA ligase family protein [Chthoniobacterales bacterium]
MRWDDPLLAAWEETLARKRDAPAIFNTRGEVVRTFRQIEERARADEAKFPTVKPHNVNAIQIGNHENWPSIFLACLRTQRVVLPIDESVGKEQADTAVSIAAKSGIVDWGDKPPSLFKLTSGTTARPRLVRFRSGQLLADCDQICETMGIEDVDLNFGVIPISHSYGFSNLLTPLIARGVPLVLSRDRTPRALLADIARTNATVFPGTPAFYQALAEIDDAPVLPRLRLCISAGAPLSVSVARKFQQKFSLPIHSFYGASECGGICYDREAANDIDGFVGQPMKHVDVAMIDDNAQVSQVRVRSATVGDGYFPDANEEKLGNGVFVPDDLLTKTAQGFRIVGRVSDVINVAGKKVHPAEIEAQLRRFAGVREAIAFGRESTLRNEEVAACVVGNTTVTEDALLEFCRQHLSSWQVPRRIFIVDELPVNERGKISRRELARQFVS